MGKPLRSSGHRLLANAGCATTSSIVAHTDTARAFDAGYGDLLDTDASSSREQLTGQPRPRMERRRFRCPTCAYCAAQKSTLESHIIRKHRPVSGSPDTRVSRLRSQPLLKAIRFALPASEILRCCGQIRPAVLQAQHKRRRVASSRSNETPQSGGFVSSAWGFVSSGDLDAPVEGIEVVLSIEVPEAATAPEA